MADEVDCVTELYELFVTRGIHLVGILRSSRIDPSRSSSLKASVRHKWLGPVAMEVVRHSLRALGDAGRSLGGSGHEQLLALFARCL